MPLVMAFDEVGQDRVRRKGLPGSNATEPIQIFFSLPRIIRIFPRFV